MDSIDILPSEPASEPAAEESAWDPGHEYHIASVMLTDPTSINAEAIRSMRTRIMAQHVREGRRALAFCTPSVGSGCTYAAFNLAVAMAQIGVRTVIVDGDLRTPSVAGLFDLPAGSPGLSEYLADDGMRLSQIINGDVLPNLSVVPAGAVPANPQELLSGDRFRSAIDQLLRQFQLTIIDTTPSNTCTDAQRVATVAGYSLIVARKHKTHYSDVQMLARLLRADRSVIVGTVLNDF